MLILAFEEIVCVNCWISWISKLFAGKLIHAKINQLIIEKSVNGLAWNLVQIGYVICCDIVLCLTVLPTSVTVKWFDMQIVISYVLISFVPRLALSLKPNDALLYKRRADVRGKMGRKEAALKDYRRAIDLTMTWRVCCTIIERLTEELIVILSRKFTRCVYLIYLFPLNDISRIIISQKVVILTSFPSSRLNL